jgi:uncharacterized membrane protein
MIKFLKELDWLSLVLYALFGWLLAVGGVGVLTQPLIFFGALAILVVVDIRSHNGGLKRGVEITKEIWEIK